MKTLIFIILKIGEIAAVVLSFILVTLIIMFLFDWILSDNAIEWLVNWINIIVGSTMWCIVMIPLWIWCFFIIVVRNFKSWITQNKVWSEKIYNKLKAK